MTALDHGRDDRASSRERDTRSPSASFPPVSLGRHQLLFPVGHGGMSDVYLALVSSAADVHKLLVVKQLRASLLDEPDALSMFMDEARLAARLHHPNVVQTFEVGQEGPIPYMSMEFLDGQPLHRILRRVGVGAHERPVRTPPEPLTLAMRLRIVTEMLEALHYAHELRDYDSSPLQVVHRDVSPQNLFITYDGQIKLVDFGIAKATHSITHTEGRGLKGKLAYMSPQQAGGESVDRRADIFAAGVMLWEMLSGRRLWADCNDATVARRLVAHDLPELGFGFDELPPRLIEVCATAMAPELDQRYPTAEAFRVDLEQFMDGEGLDASPRSIGKQVALAFADEQAQMRARIDRELMRSSGAEVEADLGAPELWRDGYRGETSDRTLDSGTDTNSSPEEVTADYGPSDGFEAPEPERPEPPREVSGVIGAPAKLPEIPPAPRDDPSDDRTRMWATIGFGLLCVGLLVTAFVRQRGDAKDESAATNDERGEQPQARDTNPTPLPAPGEGDCDAADKPIVTLSGELDEDATLHCDRDYVLKFNTRVAAGVTLTIEPGTHILGDRQTKGALIVQPGARLVAEGTAERPIVFTSAQPEAERQPGDWGGVVMLGRAPINLRDAEGKPMLGHVEGVTGAMSYGGDKPDDDSGVLRYVRIEYPGVEIAPANELNGLTLAGVGRGTTIDHVQVRATSDDCFEFFGGTVDAKHLVCDAPGDDAFDFDHGYQGRLQYVVVRDHAIAGSNQEISNGLELDNDPNGTNATPRTQPTIHNLTLCGVGGARSSSYAILARRAALPHIGGVLISGFDYAVDVRDAATEVALAGVSFIAQPVAEVDEADDDQGFDEVAWLADPARASLVLAPEIITCDQPPSSLVPAEALVADGWSGPPDDGFFDSQSRYLGAFAGSSDDWTAGWTAWTE